MACWFTTPDWTSLRETAAHDTNKRLFREGKQVFAGSELPLIQQDKRTWAVW
jgi:hypothetical protein